MNDLKRFHLGDLACEEAVPGSGGGIQPSVEFRSMADGFLLHPVRSNRCRSRFFTLRNSEVTLLAPAAIAGNWTGGGE